jgi:hypothetical protein
MAKIHEESATAYEGLKVHYNKPIFSNNRQKIRTTLINEKSK